jgi:hypothetical protein
MVRLVLVGEGSERHALGASAEGLGIEQAVEFAGSPILKPWRFIT